MLDQAEEEERLRKQDELDGIFHIFGIWIYSSNHKMRFDILLLNNSFQQTILSRLFIFTLFGFHRQFLPHTLSYLLCYDSTNYHLVLHILSKLLGRIIFFLFYLQIRINIRVMFSFHPHFSL